MTTPRKASEELQERALAWASAKTPAALAGLEGAAVGLAESCGWEERGNADQLAAVMAQVVKMLERNEPGRDGKVATKADVEVGGVDVPVGPEVLREESGSP